MQPFLNEDEMRDIDSLTRKAAAIGDRHHHKPEVKDNRFKGVELQQVKLDTAFGVGCVVLPSAEA